MVSNKFLAALSVKLGFHKHLRSNGTVIEHQNRDFVGEIEEAEREANGARDYWTNTKQPPKVLYCMWNDILEILTIPYRRSPILSKRTSAPCLLIRSSTLRKWRTSLRNTFGGSSKICRSMTPLPITIPRYGSLNIGQLLTVSANRTLDIPPQTHDPLIWLHRIPAHGQ